PRISSSGCAAISVVRAAGEEADRLAVAVKGSHIDVGLPAPDPRGLASLRQPCVDQSADILVSCASRAPEVMKVMINAPRHSESSPDPTCVRSARLDLDAQHAPALV